MYKRASNPGSLYNDKIFNPPLGDGGKLFLCIRFLNLNLDC
jgi:hypothetical protein